MRTTVVEKVELPQPRRWVEEWEVGLDEHGCRVVKVPGTYSEGDCLLSRIGDHHFTTYDKGQSAEWLRYYYILLPDGRRIETTSEAAWWDVEKHEWRPPVWNLTPFRPVFDVQILPTGVPMHVVEG